MRYSLLVFFVASVIAGCKANDGPPPDRRAGPEAALLSARAALHRRDLASYYDALTDDAVFFSLQNSIAICEASRPSAGCEGILARYGWVRPSETEPGKGAAAWEKAVKAIQRPRQLAAELETDHRAAGRGTTFVWEYLDPVQLTDIKMQGDRATATAVWSGEPKAVVFERHPSGWRMDPFPEITELSKNSQ